MTTFPSEKSVIVISDDESDCENSEKKKNEIRIKKLVTVEYLQKFRNKQKITQKWREHLGINEYFVEPQNNGDVHVPTEINTVSQNTSNFDENDRKKSKRRFQEDDSIINDNYLEQLRKKRELDNENYLQELQSVQHKKQRIHSVPIKLVNKSNGIEIIEMLDDDDNANADSVGDEEIDENVNVETYSGYNHSNVTVPNVRIPNGQAGNNHIESQPVLVNTIGTYINHTGPNILVPTALNTNQQNTFSIEKQHFSFIPLNPIESPLTQNDVNLFYKNDVEMMEVDPPITEQLAANHCFEYDGDGDAIMIDISESQNALQHIEENNQCSSLLARNTNDPSNLSDDNLMINQYPLNRVRQQYVNSMIDTHERWHSAPVVSRDHQRELSSGSIVSNGRFFSCSM